MARIRNIRQRQVGIAHQFLDAAAIARADGRADAGPDIEQLLVHAIRLAQPVDDGTGQQFHARLVAGVADNHGELVAAQTAATLALAHQALQSLRDLRQQLVADEMPQRIVHRLEAVEVDHQESAARAPFVGVTQRVRHCLVQHQAVGQCRQRVVAGEIGDLLGRFLSGRHVRTDPPETGVFTPFVEHGCARQLPPAAGILDRDLDHEVGKALAVLYLLGQLVEAWCELPRRPAIARDQLDEAFAFDFRQFSAERVGEPRRDRAQAAVLVELEQPVRIGILVFAEQQRHHFARLVHIQLRDAGLVHPPGPLNRGGGCKQAGESRDRRQV
jgi:hypothetical protein